MHPFLRVVVILLVGAAIGAVVAGGAISYVNGSPQPVPTPRVSSTWETSSAAPADEDRAGERSVDAQSVPPPNIGRSRGGARFYGSEGPIASVSTDSSSAPPPSPRPRKSEKKNTPVVEEEAEPKSSGVREEGVSGDADGGSVR